LSAWILVQNDGVRAAARVCLAAGDHAFAGKRQQAFILV
jgi:hypothetical protein